MEIQDYLNKPEKPLVPGIGELQVDQFGKVFFYETPNGKVIHTVNENDAYNLHKKYKQYGVSDGSLFRKAVQEAHAIFNEKGLAAAQERIRQGEREEMEKAKGNFVTPRVVKVFEPNGPTGFKPRI